MCCDKKAKYTNTFDSQPLCNVHAKQYYKNYTKNNSLKPFKVQDSRTLNFDSVKIRLIQELEARKLLLTSHAVVIENQPSFKNPRMKSIASTLYDYYLIRGVFDKTITESNIIQVKFMSPSNKLKLATIGDTTELIKVKAIDESKSYKMTKTLGIKYCLELIQHLPEWIKHFNSHKKKDDLADAFLQGVYFITNNNIKNDELVLSFDVGVIHLAYCLLKRTSVNNINIWQIIEWDNIDLTDRSLQKCHCGKNASFTHNTSYYCKVHSKKIVLNCKKFDECFTILNTKHKCSKI